MGGSSDDASYCVQPIEGNGFIAAGYTFSNDGDVSGNHGYNDCWIVRLDNNGIVVWQKLLGGTLNDEATWVEQTSDGGFIVAGSVTSNDGDVSVNYGSFDYWIVKLDSSGNLLWEKSYGGSDADNASYVQQTTDGGYLVAGISSSNNGDVTGAHGFSDYWILKLDENGDLEWQKTLGGSKSEFTFSAQQTTDTGYIIGGSSRSNDGDVSGNHGGDDDWIVKLDADGNIVWQKSIGGSSNDWAQSIRQTFDGGYVVAGHSYSTDGDVGEDHGFNDYWIMKLDVNGGIEWQKFLGGTNDDQAYYAEQTDEGGYIVSGFSWSNDGDVGENYGYYDYWIVKLAGQSQL